MNQESMGSLTEADRGHRLFAIVSWGNAGTHWLAKLLNAHPDVFCVHNLRNKFEVRGGLLGAPRLRQLRRRFTGSVGYMEKIRREGAAYALAGDVHGVPPRDAPGLTRHFGEGIRCAVVVRHPVVRVRSRMSAFYRDGLKEQGVRFRTIRKSLDPGTRELLDSREKLFFAHVVQMTDRIRREVEVGPVFTLERLTADPAEADRLLAHLSAGGLSFPPQLFREEYAKPVMIHSAGKTTDDPEEIFLGWEPWQRRAFCSILSAEARTIYQELGYDLGFLTRPTSGARE